MYRCCNCININIQFALKNVCISFSDFFLGGGCVCVYLLGFLCVVFVLVTYILCLCPMLSVSLDCLFVIAPSVFPNIYLSFCKNFNKCRVNRLLLRSDICFFPLVSNYINIQELNRTTL